MNSRTQKYLHMYLAIFWALMIRPTDRKQMSASGEEYRTIVDCCNKAAIDSGSHVYVELLNVMNATNLSDFDRSILFMNLYYRQHEFMYYVPKFIIP